MKKAFTLAEVMIVLAIIGILTAILLPVAQNATPNENILKFKKAHTILHNAIAELVTSDKYYLNGDLGVKIDGNIVNSPTYFCETIADVLNVKEISCSSSMIDCGAWHDFNLGLNPQALDDACWCTQNGAEITIDNNVVFYQTTPKFHFGTMWDATEQKIDGTNSKRLFGEHLNSEGIDVLYKTFCIDIDGINNGEAPFGYGIRADGKILNGVRAQEWLEKSTQEK